MSEQSTHPTSPADQPGPITDTVLQAVRDAAGKDGAAAADTWAHTTLYTRTATERADAACAALLLDDGADPEGLPTAGEDAAELAVRAALSAVSANDAGPTVPGDDLRKTYLDTHVRVRREQAAAHCRTALAGPHDAGQDWSHVGHDRIRIGGIGVFAGDWSWYVDGAGRDRIRTGFVGLLIDTWNGWAVFACTRQVAEAIVADQGRTRAAMRADAVAAGAADPDSDVDQSMSPMWFDADTLVVDQRATADDPDAIDRITARDDGTWVVMGWNWCWTVVEPGDCDAVVGDLPTADGQQMYELLTHAPGVRVPNHRLRVTSTDLADKNPDVIVYHLHHDRQHVANLTTNWRTGDRALLPTSVDAETAMRRFADECRRFGKPMTVPEVADALVNEYDLGRYADRADAGGLSLLRLLDDDGRIRDVLMVPIPPKPRVPALRDQLRRRPAVAGATRWELWTGRSWYPLGVAVTPPPAPEVVTPPETPTGSPTTDS